MNRSSKKFFIIAMIIIVIPIAIRMYSFEEEIPRAKKVLPDEMNQLALEYLLNLSDEKPDNLPELILINYTRGEANFFEIIDAIYEIEQDDTYLEYRVVFEKDYDGYKVIQHTFSTNDTSLDPTKRNSQIEKTELHYLMLIVWIGLLIFSLYSSALCYGTTPIKKWKRSLLTLLGVGQLAFKWKTSLITYNIFSIAIPPIGIGMNFFGKNRIDMIIIHFPVGLLLYWFKWHKEIQVSINENT